MRWELLFADLEAEFDARRWEALDAEVAERTRAEHAALTLADRLRGQVGRDLRLRLIDGEPLDGRLREVGAEWLMVDAGPAAVLVPMPAVVSVSGLSVAARAGDKGLLRRLPITVILRGLSRDRATVQARLIGGGIVTGTLDRVGSDHVDVAEHGLDEPRRATAVRAVTTVRLGALVWLRVR